MTNWNDIRETIAPVEHTGTDYDKDRTMTWAWLLVGIMFFCLAPVAAAILSELVGK